MKKFILSQLILIIVIGLGLLSINSIKTSSNKLLISIEKTSTLVNNSNWDEAKTEMDKMKNNWSEIENIWALLIDHLEIDNIEISIIKSKKYIETKNSSLSLTELDNLKYMVDHIFTKELINLKNIF